jgi:hypothetical protein
MRARQAISSKFGPLVTIAITVGLIAFIVIGMGFVSFGGSHISIGKTMCGSPCTIVITSQGVDNGKLVLVTKGTVVSWHNEDAISHTFAGLGNWSNFNTGIIPPGQTSKSVQLSADGTYLYYCETSMTQGEIQVIG